MIHVNDIASNIDNYSLTKMNSAVPAPRYPSLRHSSTAAPVMALRNSGSTAGDGVS